MSLSDRKIGETFIHPIGFGAMGIGGFYGAVDSDEERFKVLDAAYATGSRHWDTSNIYVLRFKRTGNRKNIFLATKFGITATGSRGDPAYVKEAFATSLERLGTDYVDLYYQHRSDPNVPIEETIGAMAELVKEGKVKYLGVSECTANGLRRAHAVHPISAIQFEFSPFVLDIEDPQSGILQTARDLGITVVVYSPLARGLVTGQYKSQDDFEAGDFRRTIPKYSSENFPKILALSDRLKKIGASHDATAGQVALAWILAQGEDMVVIPGTKKVKYVEENMGAGNVKLSAEEVASVRKIAEDSVKDIPGGRYGEAAGAMTAVETPALVK